MANTTKTRKPMSAKSKASIWLAILLVITLGIGILSVTGMNLDSEGLQKLLPWVPVSASNWPASLALDSDLSGGTFIEMTASAPHHHEEGEEHSDEEADEPVSSADLDKTVSIIQKRLAAMGYKDAVVKRSGDSGVRLEIANVQNLNAAVFLAAATGEYEFRTADGDVILTNTHIKSVDILAQRASSTSTTVYYYLDIRLTNEGKTLFADATTQHAGEAISVYYDDQLLVSPSVDAPIKDGRLTVSFGLDAEYSRICGIQMSSEALPVSLTTAETGTFEARMGKTGLTMLLAAAAVLLLAACAYFVVKYSQAGIAAVWMLVCDVILVCFLCATILFTYFPVSALVAMLVGILISVVMAVLVLDAYKKALAEGTDARQARKTALRGAAPMVWYIPGGVLVLAIILMLFSATATIGNVLAVGVVCAVVSAALLLRCFMSALAGVFGDKAVSK